MQHVVFAVFDRDRTLRGVIKPTRTWGSPNCKEALQRYMEYLRPGVAAVVDYYACPETLKGYYTGEEGRAFEATLMPLFGQIRETTRFIHAVYKGLSPIFFVGEGVDLKTVIEFFLGYSVSLTPGEENSEAGAEASGDDAVFYISWEGVVDGDDESDFIAERVEVLR